MTDGAGDLNSLPDADSPELHLAHPTQQETTQIWNSTAEAWSDSLALPAYLEDSRSMASAPLARDGGMTTWILVDRRSAPDQRHILSSCESFRKRALTSGSDGAVEDSVVHGIASVFCAPLYRRRGYAARMMKELRRILFTWQTERALGSVLYSDIGKEYYAKLGWHPNSRNDHLVLQPSKNTVPNTARLLGVNDLPDLCKQDEAMIRKLMATPVESGEGPRTRMTIVPDIDHMLWHITKEDFACKHLFGHVPTSKGAIVGEQGERVWAIWARRYYAHPDDRNAENVLSVLRLVVEGAISDDYLSPGGKSRHRERLEGIAAVLGAAQAEAAAWKLDYVKLWEPSELVFESLRCNGIEYLHVDRGMDSVASGLWYDDDGVVQSAPRWVNNEHYAWC